jgi:hypothetical protein
VEISKAEIAFTTNAKDKLEVEGLVNKTFSESLQIEHNALQKQLEIKRNMLETEGIVLGDALLVDIKLDFLKLEDAIAKVN